MEWDFKSGAPIYQQIVRTMQMRIARGMYLPGEKMPAVRDLAIEAGVNPNTMQRALAELERDGLVCSARTSGRFVTADEQQLEQLRTSLSEEIIRDFYRQMRQLWKNDEKIMELAMKWGEEEEGEPV